MSAYTFLTRRSSVRFRVFQRPVNPFYPDRKGVAFSLEKVQQLQRSFPPLRTVPFRRKIRTPLPPPPWMCFSPSKMFPKLLCFLCRRA